VSSKGARDIAMANFPQGYMTPSLEPDEMVTGVTLPLWPKGHGHAFIEFSRRHGDFAICSAAALLEEDRAGRITRASVTIGGMGPAPVRAREVESAITGQAASEAMFRQACESCRKIEAMSDVHAPSDYRQHLATVLSRRALMKAHERVAAR
jgi:aerobic carbon-monoxide dehydrogenase medium subunit